MVSFEHTVLFSFSFNHIKSFHTHYVLIFISLTHAACFFFHKLTFKSTVSFFLSATHTQTHTLLFGLSSSLSHLTDAHLSSACAGVCFQCAAAHLEQRLMLS